MDEHTPSEGPLKVGDPPKEDWEGEEEPERSGPEGDPDPADAPEEPDDQN